MSQIIYDLEKEIGPVRFSILSENKIQLEYKVPINSMGITISYIKIKLRYRKFGEEWKIIPIKEKFLNGISMRYAIKKKNIKFSYYPKKYNQIYISPNNFIGIKINVDNKDYNISTILTSINFDDSQWRRNMLLNNFLDEKY